MAQIDPKSSGGGGFSFEDKVGAYFASFMLLGSELFPTLQLGHITKIKFQRKGEGWYLDDLILEFENKSLKKSVAFSIKSNSQITAKKLPNDLVRLVWEQFTKQTLNPFIPERDYLGIITSEASHAAKETFNELLRLAANHRGSNLNLHVSNQGFTNQNVREMLASTVKPDEVSNPKQYTESDLLQRFIYMDLILDNPTSIELAKAFENMRLALTFGSANALWIFLQNIVKDTRSAAGELEFSSLTKALENNFKFRGQNDLSRDIEKIKLWTTSEIEKNKSTIGSQLTINRDDFLKEELKKETMNALIGSSGIGKSTLLKEFSLKNDVFTIWLPHSVFKARTLPEIQTLVGLENDIFEIFNYGPSNQLVIIDAIDRITDEDGKQLLKQFLIKLQSISKGRHTCIVSCQDQVWRTVVGSLSSQTVSFNVIESPALSDNDLEIASKQFPSLSGILNVGGTKDVLKNPKYLDLAVNLIENSKLDTNKELSETSLAKAFCDDINSQPSGSQNYNLLLKLSITQADSYDFQTHLGSYDAREIELLNEMVKRGFIILESNHARFAHDLYGDWLRFNFLAEKKEENLGEILTRKNNPLWHQAFRFYSLHLLENGGVESWKRTILKLQELNEDLIIDLFLDIAITLSNQMRILSTIRELLLNDNCKYLVRFLERFLAYATAPNPIVMSKREEWGISEITAAGMNRIPLYLYWPKVLLFLHSSLGLINGARSQLSVVAEKWLTTTSVDFPFRKHASDIVYECAHRVFVLKHSEERVYFSNEFDKICYQAMLAGFNELPEKIASLSLKLIGIEYHNLFEEKSKPEESSGLGFRRRIEKKPWDNGPNFKKDDAFKDIVLNSHNMSYLIRSNPDLVSKLLLAAIIENPKEWEDIYSGSGLRDSFGTDHFQEFYPPFHTKGVFSIFFSLAPMQALKTLIILTDFVTERFIENERYYNEEDDGFIMNIGGIEKLWKGDSKVYSWSYDLAHCPNILVSFLMAYENWLYDLIHKDEDIVQWIDLTLKESNSLALIGVLVSVAKKKTDLLLNKLKEIVVEPYLIWWDQQLSLQNRNSFAQMISWTSQDNFMIDKARDWFGLEHRKITLEQWATLFLFNIPEMSELFSNARSKWQKEVDAEYDLSLDALICKFDPVNYTAKTASDGQEYWNYSAPKRFLERNKEHFEENDVGQLQLMFPFNFTKVLNSENFSADHISILEKQANRISSYIGNNEVEDFLFAPDKCLLAIDALKLLAAKRNVLSLRHDEIQALQDNIFVALESLWKDPHLVQYPDDISDDKYDAILAKVIGELCVGRETDKWIRTCIALILCGPRHVPVKCLIQKVIQFKISSDSLLQTINFSFEFNKMKSTLDSIANISSHQYTDKKESVTKRWLCKSSFIRKSIYHEYSLRERQKIFEEEAAIIFKAYVENRTNSSWPKWNFDKKTYRFSQSFVFWERTEDIIDLDNFISIIGQLPFISEWPKKLSNGWPHFICGGIDQLTNRHKKNLARAGKIDGTPYQQDTWLVNIFAETFLFFDSPNIDRSLKEFLSLGTEAKYWIDDFGKHLLRKGSKNKEVWPILIKKIEILMEIAESIDLLKKDRWSAYEIWCSFVGLDDIFIGFYPDDSGELLKLLFPIQKNLLHKRNSFDCLVRFVYLMQKPAAFDIQLHSLEVVANGIKNKDLTEYGYKRHIPTFADYISRIWEDNQEPLMKTIAYREPYQEILSSLAKTQNSKALEIASKLASMKKS